MSTGARNVTTTTRTEPSPFLTGPIQSAAGAAQNIFSGANPIVTQGRLALANRGLGGSPVVGDAQQLTRSTLQGDFLSPDTNPFLAQTFNRAADLTRGRLASEFAGSGRNLGASAPARSEELQTLSSNIFGQNFARERALQANAVNQALPLANQDFRDIGAVIDAGLSPSNTLINQIQALAPAAGGTAVGTQPVFRNTAGNILGGAATGAQLGGIIPGIGPLFGAIGGGLTGLFG